MGLDYHSAQFLKSLSPWHPRTLTCGRQNWWLSRREARKINCGWYPLYSPTNYAEAFWTSLGSCDCQSVDIVPDEQPDHISDLSKPGALNHMDPFDQVVDLGTGEHVADQGAYWRNLVEAVVPGGRLIGILPADGLCGHGLYQFSPEFFARLRPFTVERLGWLVYGLRVRFVPFREQARHQRKFRWPAYVAFSLWKQVGEFSMPVQNAAVPTTPPRSGLLAQTLAEVPGIRLLERLWRSL